MNIWLYCHKLYLFDNIKCIKLPLSLLLCVVASTLRTWSIWALSSSDFITDRGVREIVLRPFRPDYVVRLELHIQREGLVDAEPIQIRLRGLLADICRGVNNAPYCDDVGHLSAHTGNCNVIWNSVSCSQWRWTHCFPSSCCSSRCSARPPRSRLGFTATTLTRSRRGPIIYSKLYSEFTCWYRWWYLLISWLLWCQTRIREFRYLDTSMWR